MVKTQPSKLIRNLDDLPLPAYDMMPMHLYGKSRYLFSPGGTTLHHSRGCTSKCSFVRGGQRWQIEKLMSMEMKLFLRDGAPSQ